MKRPLYLLCLLLGLAPALLHALPRHAPVPGGVIVAEVDAPLRGAWLGQRRLAVLPREDGAVIVAGLPLSQKPDTVRIRYETADGRSGELRVAVRHKDYPEQHLTIANRRKVEPNAEDLKRIRAEQAKKRRALAAWRDQPPALDFLQPVEGVISSRFGLRRFYNGKPRRPHGGLDIAAPEGTPIRAPADGVVLLADDFFFSGNVVYLDHGQGVISYYAHMSERKVRPGQRVRRGEVIGLVGSTGRVTGPHLHWGVYLNGTPVDPSLFLPERHPTD